MLEDTLKKKNSLPPFLSLFSHSVVSDPFNPMDCSTPGFPFHHQLPEPAQTHVH